MWLDDVHKMLAERKAFDKSEDGILLPLQHRDSTIREQRKIIVEQRRSMRKHTWEINAYLQWLKHQMLLSYTTEGTTDR